MRPLASGSLRVAIAIDGERGLEDGVAHEFGRCKAFAIVDIEGGVVKRVEMVRNPGAQLSHGKGPVAAKRLAEMGVGAAICGEFGPGASAMLDELGIRRIAVEPGRRALDALREGGLIER